MRAALGICGVLLAVASAAEPDADEILRQARAKVLDNSRRMPRYTCVETVSRTQYLPVNRGASCRSLLASRQPASSHGNLMVRDRLRLDVAVVEGREMFSWAGARRFETRDVGELAGGASSNGEFGFFLSGVFGGALDTFRYAGRRNDSATFEYHVPVAKSSYTYRAYGPTHTIGYQGTFSVNPADGDLQQLVVESEEFAAGDAVCRLQHVMDYKRVQIGNGDFLLPEVSTMDALYRGGAESVNETHYADCREYVGESSVRFDDAGAAARPAASNAVSQPLPGKVRLLIGLSQPINTETAAAGDQVDGFLLRDATDGKLRPIAKAQDRVHGRVLRLQQYMEPTPRWFVAIRFDTIERNGVDLPIVLKPVDDGDRSVPRLKGRARPGAIERPEGVGVFVFAEPGNMVLDDSFHSEWETR